MSRFENLKLTGAWKVHGPQSGHHSPLVPTSLITTAAPNLHLPPSHSLTSPLYCCREQRHPNEDVASTLDAPDHSPSNPTPDRTQRYRCAPATKTSLHHIDPQLQRERRQLRQRSRRPRSLRPTNRLAVWREARREARDRGLGECVVLRFLW